MKIGDTKWVAGNRATFLGMAKMTDEQMPSRQRSRYPWDTWSNGKTWMLERGVDYTVSDVVMQKTAHAYATNHFMRVTTRKGPEGIRVQFFKTSPAKKVRPLRKQV